MDPSNHYWIVSGSTTQVWSSATRSYVPIDDPAYLAWLNPDERRAPTRIKSEAELWEVLALQAPSIAQSIPAALDIMKELVLDAAQGPMSLGLTFKILLNHENRIRSLESRPAVTAGQFRAALKSLI